MMLMIFCSRFITALYAVRSFDHLKKQKFRGSRHHGDAPFSKHFCGHVEIVTGNMYAKFDTRSYSTTNAHRHRHKSNENSISAIHAVHLADDNEVQRWLHLMSSFYSIYCLVHKSKYYNLHYAAVDETRLTSQLNGRFQFFSRSYCTPIIGFWHCNVVCRSVTLRIVARLNDTLQQMCLKKRITSVRTRRYNFKLCKQTQ